MKSPRSIRTRMTLTLVLGLFFLSALTVAVTYGLARRALTAQFDSVLLAKARGLATLLHLEEDGEYEFEFTDEMIPEFQQRRGAEYFQIWLPDGTVLKRSQSLGTEDLPKPVISNRAVAHHDLLLPDGTPGRAVRITFTPHLEESPRRRAARSHIPLAALTVAVSRRPLDSTLATLLGVLLGGGLLIPLFGAVLVLGAVRRELRPLDSLAAQAKALGPSTLERRFLVPDAPLELEPIQTRLNELLDRLEAAFERERRFSSDVSHELRTPLAEARTAVELAARWPEDTELHRTSCCSALEAMDQMQALLSKLLLLVRSEAGHTAVEAAPVDLASLTSALVSSFEGAAAAREVLIEWNPGEPVTVETDSVLASACFRNLIENAVEYAPAGSAVRLECATEGGEAVWSIRNPAPDLEQSDLEEMFSPFWRKDLSRTGETHAGLGLSLVASFARLLGFRIRGELTGGKEILIVVNAGPVRAEEAPLANPQPTTASATRL